MSFIILLFALYVVAGGVLITGTLRGGPLVNAGILVLGTAMASIVGTTGAAMILVRPLIRANATRSAQRARRGVFHLPGRQYRRRAVAARRSAAVRRLPARRRFLLDHHASRLSRRRSSRRWCWRSSSRSISGSRAARQRPPPPHPSRCGCAASINLPLIACIIGAILLSAAWKPGIEYDVYGTHVALQNLVRDGALVVIALASLWLTPEEHRKRQRFHLGADRRGGQAVRRHFRLHHPGAGDAGGRPRRAVRLAAHGGHRARTARRTRSPISGSPAFCRPSSTTRRLIWCSSSSPAATPPR